MDNWQDMSDELNNPPFDTTSEPRYTIRVRSPEFGLKIAAIPEKIQENGFYEPPKPTPEERQAVKDHYEAIWDGSPEPPEEDRDWEAEAIVRYNVPTGGWFGPSKVALMEALATATRAHVGTLTNLTRAEKSLDAANKSIGDLSRKLFAQIASREELELRIAQLEIMNEQLVKDTEAMRKKLKAKARKPPIK